MDERIILYTTPGCDVCDNARSDLKAAKVDFEERNVMKNKGWFDEALRYSVSVPILVQNRRAEVGWKGAVG